MSAKGAKPRFDDTPCEKCTHPNGLHRADGVCAICDGGKVIYDNAGGMARLEHGPCRHAA